MKKIFIMSWFDASVRRGGNPAGDNGQANDGQPSAMLNGGQLRSVPEAPVTNSATTPITPMSAPPTPSEGAVEAQGGNYTPDANQGANAEAMERHDQLLIRARDLHQQHRNEQNNPQQDAPNE